MSYNNIFHIHTYFHIHITVGCYRFSWMEYQGLKIITNKCRSQGEQESEREHNSRKGK